MGAFTCTLESLSPPIKGGDKMKWCLRSKGVFDIKSFYGVLRGSSSITFLWKSIWDVKAPCRVLFFVWTAAWGRVLTMDHLRKRGCIIMNWCCLCKCVWIICFYIVVRFFGYGALPLDILVFLGFYLKGLLACWLVGGIGWGSILQMFGIWYHIVWCGLFGRKEIITYLKNRCFLGISS